VTTATSSKTIKGVTGLTYMAVDELVRTTLVNLTINFDVAIPLGFFIQERPRSSNVQKTAVVSQGGAGRLPCRYSLNQGRGSPSEKQNPGFVLSGENSVFPGRDKLRRAPISLLATTGPLTPQNHRIGPV